MWNYINNAPLDMNLYLILLTLLPFTMFINSKSDDVLQAKVIYMIQAFLLACLYSHGVVFLLTRLFTQNIFHGFSRQ